MTRPWNPRGGPWSDSPASLSLWREEVSNVSPVVAQEGLDILVLKILEVEHCDVAICRRYFGVTEIGGVSQIEHESARYGSYFVD